MYHCLFTLVLGKLEFKYFSSPASYLPNDTSLSTVSTPVPRMLSKDCPASEYNKSRTKVSCNTAGVLQDKKNMITNCCKQTEKNVTHRTTMTKKHGGLSAGNVCLN